MLEKIKKTDLSLPKAVVFSCLGGTQGALSVVRTLGREGVPVTVVSEYEESLALKSRYCTEPIVIESLFNDRSKTLSFLVSYAQRQEKKPVLFPTSDPDLLFMSEFREELGKHYDMIISSKDIIDNFTDKRSFFYFANKYNFPIPHTMIPENMDDVMMISKDIKYPVIVKPALPLSWMNENVQEIVKHKKAVTVGSGDELANLYERLSSYTGDALIQEYIPGGDDDLYSLHIYMNKRSEPIAYFTGRKVRTYPAYAGIGCFVKSLYVEEIVSKGIEILKKSNYTGLALLQFKRDPYTGSFKLIEINPRASSWNLLAYECGVNLPYIAYADTIGKNVIPPGRQKENIHYLYMMNDIMSFLEYRRNGDWTLLKWLNSLRGKKVYQHYASDDMKPFFVDTANEVKRMLRKGARVFRRGNV